MIIKLTECRSKDGAEKQNFTIYVNMNNVLTFNRSINGTDTHVKLAGAFLFVKETPEDIMRMMFPPMAGQMPPLDLREVMIGRQS
jgi:hypothetical protein